MNKKWECTNVNEKKVKELMQNYKINEILAKILVNKGLENKDEIELFINPTRNDFHDPFLMPDMKIAVDRLLKAKDNNEKIIIYHLHPLHRVRYSECAGDIGR